MNIINVYVDCNEVIAKQSTIEEKNQTKKNNQKYVREKNWKK